MKRIRLVMIAFALLAALQAPGNSHAQAAVLGTAGTRFQFVPCPPDVFPATVRVDCGFIAVHENRARSDSRTIRVAAAIVHAAVPSKRDPIVFLNGGPSFGAVSPFALNVYFAGSALIRDRDVILVDTRGTGSSQPRLGCSEFDQADEASFYTPPYVYATYAANNVQAVAACRDRLTAAGIDLAAYNSAESAADLEALRLALGYRQWNLLALSADGLLGLTYIRLYPGGIRSAIIDSGVSPQHLGAIDFLRGQAELLERAFAGCAANPACSAAYPNLRAAFFDLVDQLQAHPAMIPIPHLPGGPVVVRVDGAWLSMDVLGGVFPESIPYLLSDLRRAAHGELREVYQEWYSSPWAFDRNNFVAEGKTMAYLCHDVTGFITAADREQGARDLERFGPILDDDSPWPWYGDASCQTWNVGRAEPVQHAPVTSSIPTLVLTGEYDGVVPPLIVREIPRTLANASFYQFPAAGHLQLASFNPASPCARDIASQFLTAPNARIDSSCISSLPPVDLTPGAPAPASNAVRNRYGTSAVPR